MLLRKVSLTSPSCQVAQPVARASVCNAELSPGINSALYTWRAQRYKDTPILIPLGLPGVQSEKKLSDFREVRDHHSFLHLRQRYLDLEV